MNGTYELEAGGRHYRIRRELIGYGAVDHRFTLWEKVKDDFGCEYWHQELSRSAADGSLLGLRVLYNLAQQLGNEVAR